MVDKGGQKHINENEQEMKEQQTPNRTKYVIFLIIGLLATIIAECFEMYNPSAYTVGGLLGFFLVKPVSYFVILGIVALVIAAICKSIKKYWFPILAWLLLIAGLFDIVVGGFTEFVLRPKANQAVEELVRSGKLEVPDLDPRERLIGHWIFVNPNEEAELYFGTQSVVKIRLGRRNDGSYKILDSNSAEQWVRFEISGGDYTYRPHIRTMYYLGDGFAYLAAESPDGEYRWHVKYVGPEQSP